MRSTRSEGFTLIELLIVVVVIGVLATIAIPKYTSMRERAFVSAITSDLKSLANQQEIYHANHQIYASALADLPDFTSTGAVTLTVTEATGQGWAAIGTHSGLADRQCGFYFGDASPANAEPSTIPGTVACEG